MKNYPNHSFCSFDGKSFTTPFSNQVFIDCVDLQKDFLAFYEGRYSAINLPTLLHEFSHFECLNSPVGTALSTLFFQAQVNAIKGNLNLSFYQYIRYKTATIVLRPIFEGIALFTELDAVYSGTNRTSLPMLLAWSASSRYYPEVISEDILLSKLALGRLQRLNKKINLFSTGLNCKRGGYFLGYTWVRIAWNLASNHDNFFLDSDKFISYFKEIIFNDYKFIELLLTPPNIQEDLDIVKQTEPFAKRICQKMELFSDSEYVKSLRIRGENFKENYFQEFKEAQKKKSPDKKINNLTVIQEFSEFKKGNNYLNDEAAFLFNDIDEIKNGNDLLNTCLDELNNDQDESIKNWKSIFIMIFNRRNLFWLGSSKVQWKKINEEIKINVSGYLMKLDTDKKFDEDGDTGTATLELVFLISQKIFSFVLIGPKSIVILNDQIFTSEIKNKLYSEIFPHDDLLALDSELINIEDTLFSKIGTNFIEKTFKDVEKICDDNFLPIIANRIATSNKQQFIKEAANFGLYEIFGYDEKIIEDLSIISYLSSNRPSSDHFLENCKKFNITLKRIEDINSIFIEKFSTDVITPTDQGITSLW